MRRYSLLVSLMLLLALVAFAYVRHTAAVHPASYHTYIVERGDTLWVIAREFSPQSMDIRDYIYRLRQINNLRDSATIHPGQVLLLPLPKR